MTNEQQKAKELSELLNAFAEEKQFEFKLVNGWEDCLDVSTSTIYTHYNRMRIKPETKRVPLNDYAILNKETAIELRDFLNEFIEANNE